MDANTTLVRALAGGTVFAGGGIAVFDDAEFDAGPPYDVPAARPGGRR